MALLSFNPSFVSERRGSERDAIIESARNLPVDRRDYSMREFPVSEQLVSGRTKMIWTGKVSVRQGTTRAYSDGESGKRHKARMAWMIAVVPVCYTVRHASIWEFDINFAKPLQKTSFG